jgi:hypothetical protein
VTVRALRPLTLKGSIGAIKRSDKGRLEWALIPGGIAARR